uniref:NAC domain-containing protein n=1 Tax=Oryza punctata TaxID=4537 RepID=A0A0E0MJF5_ORYPU
MAQQDGKKPKEEGPDVTVPSGYYFAPKPEQLIRDYLNQWITGRPIEELRGIVRVADVYGSDPAALTKAHKAYGHDGKSWYFLTVAKWKGGRGGAGAAGRLNRWVEGGGTWHNSQRRRVIEGYGDRQAFEYRAPGNKKTDWLMEEIASNLPEATTDDGIMVICKVYLSPRAKEAPAPELADEEERQETNVVPGPKRLREPEVTGYDAPPQPDVGCSYSGGGGGETSQATASMDYYCSTTTHTADDPANAAYYYGDVDAIKPEAYDGDDYGIAINADGKLVLCGYGDGGIGTQGQVPLAMQNINGEMTLFPPMNSYGVDSQVEDDAGLDDFFNDVLVNFDCAGDPNGGGDSHGHSNNDTM